MSGTLLRARPRNDKPFTADVIALAWSLAPSGWEIVLGLKITAGAPTVGTDFVTAPIVYEYGDASLVRINVTRSISSGDMSGQFRMMGAEFDHAPGANVKVYAAWRPAGSAESVTLNDVSPGVLLGA